MPILLSKSILVPMAKALLEMSSYLQVELLIISSYNNMIIFEVIVDLSHHVTSKFCYFQVQIDICFHNSLLNNTIQWR